MVEITGTPAQSATARRTRPAELNILVGLVAIALVFEVLGWIFQGKSFLLNFQRLSIMILQVSVVGIIAVGVTQVIITGGIDLSSGSVVGATAMIAMSFAQVSSYPRAVYPNLTDLPVIVPIMVGLGCGLVAGLINGLLIAYTRIPPFIEQHPIRRWPVLREHQAQPRREQGFRRGARLVVRARPMGWRSGFRRTGSRYRNQELRGL
jgi:inositol transport system permease protein